ncbi:hypothetical protein [uncultured Arcticibacterium sp.]|uniref:hypothetical protein n=1 Tax=uncultured Arcticibacterium sp. TaxID=2173042 RepID=UPI0030F9719E
MVKASLFINKVVQSLFSILKVLLLSKLFPEKPIKESGSCLILGNGPSSKDTLKEFLPQMKEMTCICVNMFASNSEFEIIKPKYYVLLDPAFIDEKHESASKLIINIIEKTSWALTLIIPYHFRKSSYFLDRVKVNSNITIHYFNYTIVDGFLPLNHILYNLGIGMPLCQNVLVATIFQGIRMGFDDIYITGADHSWNENLRVSNEDNTLYLNDTHFYGQRKRNLSKEFGGDIGTIESQIAKQFISFYKVFKGHEILANFSKTRGIRIVNISNHSNIDVYKRGRLQINSLKP